MSSETVHGWCEHLYETKAAQLILYGRALGLSDAESEDVLQEIFHSLMERDSAPDEPENYCIRSFRNRALNFKRTLWRRMTRELESHRWFERATDESPAEREAMRCLAQLPPDQRETIVLKIWHEHTFEEIGGLLDISPNTAAGRHRYGLQKLKQCIKGETHERDERIGNTAASLATAPSIGEA